MKNPLFYAKILLFGEYGIIEDANGLTMPYNTYKGMLKESIDSFGTESNQILQKYAAYLEENAKDWLDIERLNLAISEGLSFDSNIPQGYGVGSSGALVAALYERFAFNPIRIEKSIDKNKIKNLKGIFSSMESYFHGKSSGVDPLICYLNIPLLIEPNAAISSVGIPGSIDGKGAIFLLDSGTPGKTGSMVEIFFQKLKNQGFRKTLKDEFIKYNNACIDAFVKGDFTGLIGQIRPLSSWVLEHFKPMIPKNLLKVWKRGIETNSYYLKLCGSGGGGYMLGFTEDYEKALTDLSDYETEVILRF